MPWSELGMPWGTGVDARGCRRRTCSRVAATSSFRLVFLEMAAPVGPVPATSCWAYLNPQSTGVYFGVITAETVQDDIPWIMTGVAATICHCRQAKSATAAGRVSSQPECLRKRSAGAVCLLGAPPASSRCYVQAGFRWSQSLVSQAPLPAQIPA